MVRRDTITQENLINAINKKDLETQVVEIKKRKSSFLKNPSASMLNLDEVNQKFNENYGLANNK